MKLIRQAKSLLKTKRLPGFSTPGMLASLVVTCLTFLLLPLSQYAEKELWFKRPAESVELPIPRPAKPELEKKFDAEQRHAPVPPKMEKDPPRLTLEALETGLEVGPGEFLSAFALSDFHTIPGEGEEFVFKLHELDRKPMPIKKGALHYPENLKNKGLEGKVRLLVQINEQGIVRVQSVISFSHASFIPPSTTAAENTIYTPPTRNGKPVKTEFVLPVNFKLTER